MKRIILVMAVMVGMIFCFSSAFASDTSEFDLYLGGGNYESVDIDAQGSYFWGKVRYRPFEFGNLRVGFFGFGAAGDGNDEDYQYDWQKQAIGLTAKFIGLHKDFDFDLGIGQLENNGSIELYKSEQVDDIFLISAHGNFYQRRDAGKDWFPKTELNFEATLTYSQDHQHSWNNDPLPPDPYDNDSVELFLIQSVYDVSLKKHLRLTPGFNLGLIHQYGKEENPSFVQFGPRFTLSWHNQDIIQMSFLNYRENLGGEEDQWQWFNAWVDIIGLIKAAGS